jgi:CheY-like chemotaxis protein
VVVIDQLQNFGNTAKSLARNPLGIIALFIVLVYGFASLVTISAGSFSSAERLPLIYFLIFFPVLVLMVFAYLVSRHSGKLFAPSDFKDEQNYVKMQMAVVASLTAATSKVEQTSVVELGKIVEAAQSIGPKNSIAGDSWRNRILWVDDRPENNTFERGAFEAIGIQFTLVTSTKEALEKISNNKYGAIISDMGRREGPREGYVLLDQIRQNSDLTPLFFYASSNEPAHRKETRDHGGQGCTNKAQELFEMVTKAIAVG